MISATESQPTESGIDLVRQVEEIFSPNGLLSRATNFEFRPQQQQMAVAVARALETKEHLVVEAAPASAKAWPTWFPQFSLPWRTTKKPSSPRTPSISR